MTQNREATQKDEKQTCFALLSCFGSLFSKLSNICSAQAISLMIRPVRFGRTGLLQYR